MLINRIVNYFEGTGASAQIAALAVIIVYICELLNWLPCLFERLCPNPVVVAVLGAVDSMGGTADAAFIIFIVIEGSGYMLFASMERNRLRAQAAEANQQAAETKLQISETNRQMAEVNQRAAEANQQAAEANQQAAEANQRTAEANQRTAEAKLQTAEANQRVAEANQRAAEAKLQIAEAEARAAQAELRAVKAEQRAEQNAAQRG